MNACVNKSAVEFKELLKETRMHPIVLAAKISDWQDKNNTDSWPTKEEITLGKDTGLNNDALPRPLKELDGQGRLFSLNDIDYQLKAIDILLSDKAKYIFNKGDKAGWPLDKILTELQIPKEQKQLLIDLKITDREKLILELSGRYGFKIEINVAKVKENSIADNEERIDGQHEGENTLYYKNLTVPGGVNYTENEISTPLITPKIKGHANFSTNNGIGWFRSDEQTRVGTQKLRDKISRITDVPISFTDHRGFIVFKYDDKNWMAEKPDGNPFSVSEQEVLDLYNKTIIDLGESTNIRRILELQSDLFQKGRNSDNLLSFENDIREVYEGSFFRIGDRFYKSDLFTNEYWYETEDGHAEFVSKQEFDTAKNDAKLEKKHKNTTENIFLQLLNKDNNWVAFFIKAIVQDSVRKGYKKVLFPTGETVSKIEGLESVTDAINRINEEIKLIKEGPLKYVVASFDTPIAYFNTINEANMYILANNPAYDGQLYVINNKYATTDTARKFRIDELEKERFFLTSQGLEKIRPIEAFYEIKIGNILEKQFGKQNIKIVVDEYGNGWREIDLSNQIVLNVISPILLSLNTNKEKHLILQEDDRRELAEKINALIGKLGFNIEYNSNFTDINGRPIEARAMVDFVNKLIQIAEGKANLSDLTEEGVHIFVRLLKITNDPLYKQMLEQIGSLPEYKDVLDEYSNISGYTDDILKEEAIGKVVKNILLNGTYKAENEPVYKSWFDKIIQWFNSLFKKINPFVKAAQIIMNETYNSKVESLGNGKMFSIGTSREESIRHLDKDQKRLEKRTFAVEELPKRIYKGHGETIERYYDLERQTIVAKRITDRAEIMRNVGKSSSEINRLQSMERTAIARLMGTRCHAVMEGIMNNLVSGESMDKVKKESKLSDAMFNLLLRDTKTLLKNAQDIQNRIDPKGELVVRTEQKMIDETEDEGGTIDLLFVYSDNTASIVEFKFKQTNALNSQINPDTKKRELRDDVLTIENEEDYDIQIYRQRTMLNKVYGIKDVRTSRLVPYAVTMAYDQGANKYLDKVVNIISPFDENEYLYQVATGGEETGIKAIDAKLRAIDEFLQSLRSKMHMAVHNSDKEKLKLSIKNLSRARQQLQTTLDVSLLLDAAYSLARPLMGDIKNGDGKILSANETHIDGKENPNYMDLREMNELKLQLKMYSEMLFENSSYIREAAKDMDEKKLLSLQQRLLFTKNYVDNALSEVEQRIEERVRSTAMEADKIDMDRHVREMTFFQKWFNTLSEFDHPVFEYARHMIFTADGQKRQKVLDIANKLEKLQKGLFDYADRIGISHMKISDKLIDDRNFALIPMYKSDLYNTILPRMRDTNNAKWIKDHFNVKESYKKRYGTFLENQKDKLLQMYPDQELSDGRVNKKDKERKEKLNTWIEHNDPTKDGFWLNNFHQEHIEMKEEFRSEYYSDQYKEIMATPELKAYYDFIVEQNFEFMEILGYDKISANFLPKVRKSMLDEFIQRSENNGITELFNLFLDSHRIGQDSVLGMYNPQSGELANRIPILFVNPYRDKEGNIDTSLNSRDLGKNLLLFAEMAYNYDAKRAIEPMIIALEDWLRMNKNGEIKASRTDEPAKTIAGRFLKSKEQSSSLDIFKRLMNYHVYGQKIQHDKAIKMFGVELSSVSLVKTVMTYHRMKTLGLAIIPPLAARVAGEGSIYFEGLKGRHYTAKEMRLAHKYYYTNKKEFHWFVKFMNVYQEDQTFRLASNLSANNITKYTTLDNMFRGYSLADEKIDNTVAVAMALSHTIDENGNVVRLTDDMKANGKKNVIELMNTDENDKLYIEGMKERAYLQFRAKIRSVTGSIKGQMASDDINAINTMLAGQLLMMYRNWMPRVVKERLGKFRYNPVTKDFEQGRYRFVASHAFNEQTTFVSLLRDVAHTGLRMFWLMDNFNKYKLGRPGTSGYDRARLVVENEYKKFLKQYEGDVRFTEGFTIDDYIDLKAGQLRAFIAEARVIVLFLSAMVAGGMDWDDDGQKEYKDLWATRKLYQVLNRAQSEWSFIWNPMEWKNFFQNPLAMSGIFTDIINITRNTIDEMRDNAFGENANNDTTPWFYFSSKMLPGINNMIRFGEVFKQDMERTR